MDSTEAAAERSVEMLIQQVTPATILHAVALGARKIHVRYLPVALALISSGHLRLIRADREGIEVEPA